MDVSAPSRRTRTQAKGWRGGASGGAHPPTTSRSPHRPRPPRPVVDRVAGLGVVLERGADHTPLGGPAGQDPPSRSPVRKAPTTGPRLRRYFSSMEKVGWSGGTGAVEHILPGAATGPGSPRSPGPIARGENVFYFRAMAFNLADLVEHTVDAVPDRHRARSAGPAAHLRRARGAGQPARPPPRRARASAPATTSAIYAYNSVECVEAMLAAYKLRAVPININYRYVEDELRYLFDNADLVAVVYQASSPPRRRGARRAADAAPPRRDRRRQRRDRTPTRRRRLRGRARRARRPSATSGPAPPTTSTSSTPAARPACPRA